MAVFAVYTQYFKLPSHSAHGSGGVHSPVMRSGQWATRGSDMCHLQVLVSQLCPTLCDPMDWSPPGSSVHGILQARILEWLPFPSPGDFPDPGIKPRSPALQADSLSFEPPGKYKPEHLTARQDFPEFSFPQSLKPTTFDVSPTMSAWVLEWLQWVKTPVNTWQTCDMKQKQTFAVLSYWDFGAKIFLLRRSVVSNSATPWTVARQAPASMRSSRQEYWSRLLLGTSPGWSRVFEGETASVIYLNIN